MNNLSSARHTAETGLPSARTVLYGQPFLIHTFLEDPRPRPFRYSFRSKAIRNFNAFLYISKTRSSLDLVVVAYFDNPPLQTKKKMDCLF